jgi:cytochrome c oxidase assembly protein subunit 15
MVAGLRAGYAYNTFPLMNGHIVPPEIFVLDPWYSNLFNNLATVQFNHRLFAWALAFFVPFVWWRARSAKLPWRTAVLFHLLLAALVLQITLGISTLLLAVPPPLGAAHQAGAIVVFTVVLLLDHALRRPAAAGVRTAGVSAIPDGSPVK